MGAQLSIVGIEPLSEPEEEICFASFWLLYPRKEAKKDSEKAWSQIPRSVWPDVIIAVAGWRREWARRSDIHYIPMPASWLRGERWEDELPVQPATHQSQVPTEREAPFIRGELPQHVRDLIAKQKANKR